MEHLQAEGFYGEKNPKTDVRKYRYVLVFHISLAIGTEGLKSREGSGKLVTELE